MSKTPERKIKDQVEELLDAPDIYSFMPVQFGMGATGLDYHCVLRVGVIPVAFFVETKKTGKLLTDRQQGLRDDLVYRMGCKVFEVYNWVQLKELERWITKYRAFASQSRTLSPPVSEASSPTALKSRTNF